MDSVEYGAVEWAVELGYKDAHGVGSLERQAAGLGVWMIAESIHGALNLVIGPAAHGKPVQHLRHCGFGYAGG